MSENDDEKKQPSLSKEEALKQSIDAVQKVLEKFTALHRHRAHRNNEHRTTYGKKWSKNDKLTCAINIEKKTVEFFLNDESMGIAFKDIDIEGNIYISLTLQGGRGANVTLLNNDKIDINDDSKWEIEGKMDMNNDTKRVKMLEKVNYDENENNISELKEGDKVIVIHNEDVIESEIQRINHKTRKMLVRLDGWKWISMDSPKLFPTKDAVNKFFNELNQNITKLGRKFTAMKDFPTATLKIPVNEITKNEFKYDVIIANDYCMQIGFSDDAFKPDSPGGDGTGDDDHSWAFDGYRVLKWGKKSEEDKKVKDPIEELIPEDFVYDFKIDYTFAITRALYAARFVPRDTLKWFVENWKDESIYKEITNEELEGMAIKYKDEGNEYYKLKKYYSAIIAYDDAIWYGSLCEAKELYICYSNRSISLAKVHEYELALADAVRCIILNKTWSKGYLRRGHALMKLRKFDESIEAYKEGIKSCDKKEHKLLKLGLNTAIKYKEIMLKKAEQREKINLVVLPMPTEENMKKELEEGVKKVEAIHIDYDNIYTFKDLISFDTFGWKLVENDNNNGLEANDDEKKQSLTDNDPDLETYMVWECDNYPATLRLMHYKRECDIKKKPIDTNMFSIRHIQRDNLLRSGLKSGVNAGLILSENFEVNKDPLIYGVEVLIKTIIEPMDLRYLSGYMYWIKIPFKNEYFELRLETNYEGQTTGHRDSMMMMKISTELKVNPLEFMQMKVWEEDPYDSLYTRGALMNLSERQEYDKLFPYHPLSILRSKLMTQFKNSVKVDSEIASKMDLL